MKKKIVSSRPRHIFQDLTFHRKITYVKPFVPLEKHLESFVLKKILNTKGTKVPIAIGSTKDTKGYK
jgi:hypothetical protein